MEKSKTSKSGWWKIGLIIVIAAAIAAIVVIKQGKQLGNESEKTAAVAAGQLNEPSKQSQLPRMVDLGAESCIPCKQMAPILTQLKIELRGIADIEFIDVWKNQAAGAEYGIRVIPTQIFYTAEGEEVFRHEGFFSREQILQQFTKMGVDISTARKE
jgi:thioredoxin 1